jgi:hypothetical protein
MQRFRCFFWHVWRGEDFKGNQCDVTRWNPFGLSRTAEASTRWPDDTICERNRKGTDLLQRTPWADADVEAIQKEIDPGDVLLELEQPEPP